MKTISDFRQQTTEGVIAFHAVSKEAIAWATMPRCHQYHSDTDNTLVFPWPSEKHAAGNCSEDSKNRPGQTSPYNQSNANWLPISPYACN